MSDFYSKLSKIKKNDKIFDEILHWNINQASKAEVWQEIPKTSVWKWPKWNHLKNIFFSKCLDIAIFAQKLSILTRNRRNSRKSFPSWLNLLNSVSEFWFETVCDWNI